MTTTNLILPSAERICGAAAPCGWKGDGGAGNLKPQPGASEVLRLDGHGNIV